MGCQPIGDRTVRGKGPLPMNRSSNRLVAAALALLLLSGARARAEMISWSYTWTPGVTVLKADPPGSGTIQLFAFGGPGGSNAGDPASLPAFVYYSSTATGSPDQFSKQVYSLTLGVTDTASSQEHDFTLTGSFQGTLSASQ